MRAQKLSPEPLPIRAALATLLLLSALGMLGCSDGQPLHAWHTEVLKEEFTADMADGQVRTFDDYLALEQRLFKQLEDTIRAKTPTGPGYELNRFSRGSTSDPSRRERNWNHSFVLEAEAPVGGVLLLHGMSDSPYSLRALGEAINDRGYQVIGLRLPGHGTAPSGLRSINWHDMAAAVRLAMMHLAAELGTRPIHIIGYSTGGPLALDFALMAVERENMPVPASLVLVSPAIRVHAASALARFKDALSALPGLDGLAYLAVMEEFDPFNYNSFATNAGAQVHAITRDVDRRIEALAQDPQAAGKLPPILALKSTVDSTVTTEAIVDNLLMRLPANRNELVLFDINRNAAIKSALLVSDPAPFTDRLMADDSLPFALTLVTNEDPGSANVAAHHKAPFSLETSDVVSLGLAWPRGVVSLSHVALAFPPDDPLYGQGPPVADDLVFLGNLAITGERGLVSIPADWLLRQRYNPFYAYLQTRVLEWLDANGVEATSSFSG
jgi:alpha-beta hydrolase superfamily lysophospholipase